MGVMNKDGVEDDACWPKSADSGVVSDVVEGENVQEQRGIGMIGRNECGDVSNEGGKTIPRVDSGPMYIPRRAQQRRGVMNKDSGGALRRVLPLVVEARLVDAVKEVWMVWTAREQ
jgi:hypothetical protein